MSRADPYLSYQGLTPISLIWDRRTALSPVIRKTKELEQRDDLTIRALKEYALKEPKLAEVLKGLGLL